MATETTGILRGLVVDEAVRPVGGATVELLGAGRTALTDGDGTFGFAGLSAGAHVMKIAKAGFLEAQVSTVVQAGVQDPPFVRVQLSSDPLTRPYYSEYAIDGFIECGTSLFDPCATVNFFAGNVTNDRSRFTFLLSANASLLQSELVWSSTQALSPQLGYGLDAFSAGCDPANYWVLNSTQGVSPLLLKVNASLVGEQGVGGACPLSVLVGASGPYCTPGLTAPAGTVASVCPGAAIEQRFTLYLHAFYHYLPPADWRFTTDARVPLPPTLAVTGA